jgi:thioredoxin reductase (NADPH)
MSENIHAGQLKIVDCDLLILGAGAAGLSAAIVAARANLKTIVIDESVAGGQIATTDHVANYPGTPGVVRGMELIQNMKQQAGSFGAAIHESKTILEVRLQGTEKYARTGDVEYRAKAVIIATGAAPRPLPAEGADQFKGRGVHYCAICDASTYQDRKVVVVGGGNSAVEEAVSLARFASRVVMIHQFDRFQASLSAQEKVFINPKIDVIWDSEVRKVNGQGNPLTSVIIENVKTKQLTEIPTNGVFVFIGSAPRSELYQGQVELDQAGYIAAGEDTTTNVAGVFAAGDIRVKPVRQLVTAAADGAVAAVMAEQYLVGPKNLFP